jgi:hypothetical protein
VLHLRHRPNLSEGWMTGYTEIGQRMLCQSHNGMDKIWVESPTQSRQGSPNTFLATHCSMYASARHEDQIHPMRSETGMGHACGTTSGETAHLYPSSSTLQHMEAWDRVPGVDEVGVRTIKDASGHFHPGPGRRLTEAQGGRSRARDSP